MLKMPAARVDGNCGSQIQAVQREGTEVIRESDVLER